MTYRHLQAAVLGWSLIVWLAAYGYAASHPYPEGDPFRIWVCQIVVLACWLSFGWLHHRGKEIPA